MRSPANTLGPKLWPNSTLSAQTSILFSRAQPESLRSGRKWARSTLKTRSIFTPSPIMSTRLRNDSARKQQMFPLPFPNSQFTLRLSQLYRSSRPEVGLQLHALCSNFVRLEQIESRARGCEKAHRSRDLLRNVSRITVTCFHAPRPSLLSTLLLIHSKRRLVSVCNNRNCEHL